MTEFLFCKLMSISRDGWKHKLSLSLSSSLFICVDIILNISLNDRSRLIPFAKIDQFLSDKTRVDTTVSYQLASYVRLHLIPALPHVATI
jgi:hypothetical protein